MYPIYNKKVYNNKHKQWYISGIYNRIPVAADYGNGKDNYGKGGKENAICNGKYHNQGN